MDNWYMSVYSPACFAKILIRSPPGRINHYKSNAVHWGADAVAYFICPPDQPENYCPSRGVDRMNGIPMAPVALIIMMSSGTLDWAPLCNLLHQRKLLNHSSRGFLTFTLKHCAGQQQDRRPVWFGRSW
jgi:hypothetical protein